MLLLRITFVLCLIIILLLLFGTNNAIIITCKCVVIRSINSIIVCSNNIFINCYNSLLVDECLISLQNNQHVSFNSTIITVCVTFLFSITI
jgi:hypothetical protein